MVVAKLRPVVMSKYMQVEARTHWLKRIIFRFEFRQRINQ